MKKAMLAAIVLALTPSGIGIAQETEETVKNAEIEARAAKAAAEKAEAEFKKNLYEKLNEVLSKGGGSGGGKD